MNVTIEKKGQLEAVLNVAVVESDYADKMKAQLKEIGKKKEIPGFRKGHIDLAQLTKRFGKMVKSDVINDVVYDAVIKYLVDNKIDILARPLPVDVKEITMDQKDFDFSFEVGLAPELNVVLDKTVTLPFYNIEVAESMMEEQDKVLRTQFGERVKVDEFEERALVKGSIMELDADGKVKEGDDAIQVNDGIVGPFAFKSKEEAEKFAGKKVGDKVVFNPYNSCEGNEAELASMLHIDRDKVESARGDFEMSIAEIIANRPAEHDQKFFDAVFGADTVHNEEEYNGRLRDAIAQSLQPNSANLFQRNAEDYLMETYGKMELPLEFLKKWILANDKNVTEENVQENLDQAIPGIKWDLIENKAAETLGVKVEKADVEALAKDIAASQLRQYGMMQLTDEIVDYYANNMLSDENTRRRVARQAFVQQLFAKMHAAVNLDEKTVSLDEFRNIVGALSNDSGEEVAAE